MIMVFMIIGSVIGGYLPLIFGASVFSISSILTSALGGFLGIWLGYKLLN